MEEEIISKEQIQCLYAAARAHDTVDRINSLLRRISNVGILAYHCCILFHDAPGPKRCPAYALLLLESPKITRFLLANQLGIDLSEESVLEAIARLSNRHIEDGRSVTWDCGDVPEKNTFLDETMCSGPGKRARKGRKTNKEVLLLLLLRLEKVFHELSGIDPPFFERLFDAVEKTWQKKILARKHPTPLTVLFSRRCVPTNSFYSFAALTALNLYDAFERAIYLSPHKIRLAILSSKFPQIKGLLPFFYKMYPELTTYDRIVSHSRLKFFERPTNIPMEPRTLRTYVQVIEEHRTLVNNLFPKMDLRSWPSDLRLFYTAEILKTGDTMLFAEVINCWFCTSPHLGERILALAAMTPSVDPEEFVRSVPAAITHFTLVLRLAKETRSARYFSLLAAILRHSPRREDVENVRDNLLYFDQSFIVEFRELIDALDK